MATELDRIKGQIEKAFNKQPWYGTSIKGILQDIDPAIVHKKVGPHSIIMLILHMIAWRRYATQKILGNDDFTVTDEMNFAEPPPTRESWTNALKELEQSQKDLMAALDKFSVSRLDELVPRASHKYTWYTLIHGIIQHDVYHLGQIALAKKSLQ